MKLKYLLSLFLAFSSVCHSLVLIDSTLASACIYYELQYDWGCKSHGNGKKAYACRCANINWLGTVTNCIRNGSDSKRLIDHAFRHLSTRCLQKADLHYTVEDLYRFAENGTHYLRDSTEKDRTVTVNTTLRVNQTDYEWYHKKFKDYTFSVQRSQWFGWGLVFYWATIVGLATVFNFSKRVFGHPLVNNWIKKHLILPSTLKSYRQRTYLFCKILPLNFHTRLNGLVVAVFIILTIISCGVGYELKLPHPYLTTRWYANLTLVSYRTDMMSISLFPVIYMFGIRNNPLIYVSGIQFSTFQFYHKWCAYACVVLLFIHSIIWTVYAIHGGGGYKMWAMDSYWKWGIAATTLAVLLIFHSEKIIRDVAYEVFLTMHQLMNVFFIVAMYYHCKDLGWLGWIWAMAGILCFDRFMRIVRIVISGGVHTATLTDCGNRSVIKMVMKKPKYFKYVAGSYAFIYFLSPTDSWYYFFQSHPFTILTEPHEDADNPDHLVFLFKANKSVTRAMLKKVLKSGKRTVTCKVMLEGPYGVTLPKKAKYDKKMIAMSAGQGICAVYPHLIEALSHKRNDNVRHKLVWIINDLTSLEWFGEQLRWLRQRNCDVKIIYTKAEDRDPESSSLDIELDEFKQGVEKLYCRPDLQSLIKSEIELASEGSVDLTILSCGPASFNDDLRQSVVNNMRSDLKISVDLEEESYSW